MSTHIAIFEYDRLIKENGNSAGMTGALPISAVDFDWLKAECLKMDVDTPTRWLNLKRHNNHECIQITGYAGVIRTPNGLQLEVLPKIGRRNVSVDETRKILFQMLLCLLDFPYFENGNAALRVANAPLLDVFIHHYLQAVSTVIKRGIRSAYSRQEGNLPALRGKLLPAQHLKQNLVRRERFYTEYDEFLTDRPENRLLRAALDRVLKWSRSHANQRLAQEQVFTFNEIEPSINIAQDLQKIRLDRGMHYYQAALDWAKLILGNQSPLTGVGNTEAISLMFPMAKLFEAYVGKHLKRNIKADFEFQRTPKRHYLTRHNERDFFRLEPDFLIAGTGKNASQTLVLDTKWKLLNSQDTSNNYGISQGDFYQLFAYSHFYIGDQEDGALVLIYPKTDDFDKPLKPFHFKNNKNSRALWVLPFCLVERKLIAPESSVVANYLQILPESIEVQNAQESGLPMNDALAVEDNKALPKQSHTTPVMPNTPNSSLEPTHKVAGKKTVFSPSDLIQAIRSPFASWMDRLAIEAPEMVEGIETGQDPMLELLAQKGNLHEARYLERLRQQFGADRVFVVEPENPRNRAQEAEITVQAMKEGYDVIFQAYLTRDNFAGSADFLLKTSGTSTLGDYHYEAWDTKLAKSSRAYFYIQLCCYSWMLEAVQGVLPQEAVIVRGDLSQDRFRLARFFSYFKHFQRQFLQQQAAFEAHFDQLPDPAFSKNYGRWESFAKQTLAKNDSLALVANICKSQISKLHHVGIKTLTDLANSDLKQAVGISDTVFERLKAQASIQLRSRGKDEPEFEILQAEKPNDLRALPPHSDGDIFFDIEGHPLVDGGLEYLWGVSYRNDNGPKGKVYAFKDWWAHTADQEKLAFEGFVDWVYARWQAYPNMHVFHYASYEVTALRKLSTRYETRIQEVADLLANKVLIDLYRIVQNGLLMGEPRYSIKNVEHLYRSRRDTGIATGGDSVVAYELWRESGDLERWQEQGYAIWQTNPDKFDWEQWSDLKSIRDYNIDDCESTLELVDWLREQQKSRNIEYAPPIADQDEQKELTARQVEGAERRQEIIDRQNALLTRFQDRPDLQDNQIARLAKDLMGFHNRERKPKMWSYFELLEKNDAELFDDDSCIIGLTVSKCEGRVIECEFDHSQSIRKDKFKTGVLKETQQSVSKIDFTDTGLQMTVAGTHTMPCIGETLTLLANEAFINMETLEKRLCEVTEAVFDNRATGALQAILSKASPAFIKDGLLPVNRTRFPENEDYLHAISRAVSALDHSYLCIQGPPGAGKTFTAKKVIADLVKAGKRIGITSNSHAAISNLLDAVYAEIGSVSKSVVKVSGFKDENKFRARYPVHSHPHYQYRNGMRFTQNQPFDSFAVVGATVYGFANDIAMQQPVDYLFVDEASQVALANMVAIAKAAKNIVLLGDQMQLEQPTQASHPENAGVSALDYLLDGHAVISNDKGIFLERTFRMHPAVCQPLSEVVYEGQLQAAPGNENQKIEIDNPTHITKPNGVLIVNVKHEHNVQSSKEEAETIREIINELKDEQKCAKYFDKDGSSHKLTSSDVLVVSPYNMQVNLLKETLGDDCKVGTIDKFQGQEAPVVIVSMAVSDLEESSRGLNFVFDIKRLNVAISRAKALAIVVCNTGLENCQVESSQHIENVNFYCRLIEC